MSTLRENGQVQQAQKNNEEKSRIILKTVAMYYHLTAYINLLLSVLFLGTTIGMLHS